MKLATIEIVRLCCTSEVKSMSSDNLLFVRADSVRLFTSESSPGGQQFIKMRKNQKWLGMRHLCPFLLAHS